MDEHRVVVSGRFWNRLEPLLPGKGTDSGRAACENRLFLEAVFLARENGRAVA